ncbi:hypothetical protein EPO33_02465 [Patescibacteria group bacterium]|nr:MAG: hypothetical protein EPO33_02465 [Patescibacteria group bacterium]
MSFPQKHPAGPPRLILADAGNVRIVYNDSYRAREVGRIFGRPAHEIHPVLHQSEPFQALERGTVTWEAFADYVELTLCRGQRPPVEWSRECFARIWVEALTEPILPVIEILEALARHVPVVSASNVDERSYCVYDRLPRARAMLRVHSDSHLIGRRKRDPDYFETLLAYVNAQLKSDPPVAPRDCVFIDDLVEHVVTAKGRGMRTVWFSEVTEANVLQLKADLLACGVPDAWLP